MSFINIYAGEDGNTSLAGRVNDKGVSEDQGTEVRSNILYRHQLATHR